ncbi:hypothetical protein MHH_c16520 [Mannheimia haemolytica M42548]|nr:hypothetical protein MHH_c16520 [Mannheimia haemolytica M42548]
MAGYTKKSIVGQPPTRGCELKLKSKAKAILLIKAATYAWL